MLTTANLTTATLDRPNWHPLPQVKTDTTVIADAYNRHEAGESVRAIARELGMSESAVRRWVANPDRWSPFLDDVALRRGLNFEPSVLAALTVAEFYELCRLLNDEAWPGFNPTRANGVDDAGKPTYPAPTARQAAWTALPERTRDVIGRTRRILAAQPTAVAA